MTQPVSSSKALVLVRHGESTWNRENRFTGWEDVPLTDRGEEEARNAGRILRARGFLFDVAFTSVLNRAIKSLWIILEELDQMWIPEWKHWALNERHYGALQGLDKAEQAARCGEEQVRLWRRSWSVRPPLMDRADVRADRRYTELGARVPLGESLEDTVARVAPYWESTIRPHLARGENVLIAAHGNSLRGLVKIIENVPDDVIPTFELPTGIPYALHLSDSLDVIASGFLGEPIPGEREVTHGLRG
jgi:2,3-bisphosphoglycerate-dependent phosphoglycerate mutase